MSNQIVEIHDYVDFIDAAWLDVVLDCNPDRVPMIYYRAFRCIHQECKY